MSYSIDVNILLYASDSSSAYGPTARKFMERAAQGPEPLCIAWLTLMSYLRMSTHAAIFTRPLSPGQARANVDALVSLPHVRVLSEQEGYWAAYQDVTRDFAVRGPLVPDAHLATILRQHGVLTLWTHDRDFLKFDHLTVRDPFA